MHELRKILKNFETQNPPSDFDLSCGFKNSLSNFYKLLNSIHVLAIGTIIKLLIHTISSNFLEIILNLIAGKIIFNNKRPLFPHKNFGLNYDFKNNMSKLKTILSTFQKPSNNYPKLFPPN